MCGIVGSIGKLNAKDVVMNGLAHLEYRGYDSAGIAVWKDRNIEIHKKEGKLKNLSEAIAPIEEHYPMAIGHTRWATHGEPSDVNSHPHVSQNGTVAIVHNGIIENFGSLKEMLEDKGYNFKSQTDTEIVANLIESLYEGNPLQTLQEVRDLIQGSYALAIIFKDQPELFGMRNESPMILSKGQGSFFLASDVPAIMDYSKCVCYLQNGDIVRLSSDLVEVYDFEGKPVEREWKEIHWSFEKATKSGYETFMLKEINEQVTTIEQSVKQRLKDNQLFFGDFEWNPQEIDRIYISACGTAYHAGLLGKYYFEKLLRIPVEIEYASEFRYKNPMLNNRTLFIAISQSGETADTFQALKLAKSLGAKTLAISNVVGSSLTREANQVIYTWAGTEIAVASTKAYTAQVTVLLLLALYMSNQSITNEHPVLSDLLHIGEAIQSLINPQEIYQHIAEMIENNHSAFYIGRLSDSVTAQEGALKLKEISYIHAECFPAGELKHGSIALIEQGTPVIALMTEESVMDKMISNIEEVRSRGAKVITITTLNSNDTDSYSDFTIILPKIDSMLLPLLAVIPTQLIAYYTTIAKNLDPDKPRNLAKSVTVE